MRIALLIAVCLLPMALGTTCIPFHDDVARTHEPATKLTVTIVSPDSDATVADGTNVEIEWTASNLTGPKDL